MERPEALRKEVIQTRNRRVKKKEQQQDQDQESALQTIPSTGANSDSAQFWTAQAAAAAAMASHLQPMMMQ